MAIPGQSKTPLTPNFQFIVPSRLLLSYSFLFPVTPIHSQIPPNPYQKKSNCRPKQILEPSSRQIHYKIYFGQEI